MAKLTTFIKAQYNALPGFSLLTFPYNAKMIGALKRYPGCRWDEPRHGWLVPTEMTRAFLQYAEEQFSWEAKVEAGTMTLIKPGDIRKECYGYQREDILKALQIKRAMLAWEMGLGKTLGGIEWLRLSKARRILVVCPAMARGVWEGELTKWWPDHPPVSVIRDGKAADAFAATVGDGPYLCVTSYELLKKLRLPAKLEAVLADESHYIKEYKIARSKALAEILSKWSVDWRLFLTGTPITVNPIDIHHQVECLYPKRLGHYFDFGDTYCGRVANSYRQRGYDYDGVNAARSEELYNRLETFIFRRTKSEVTDQLPKLITQTIRLKASRQGLKDLQAALKSGGDIEAVLAQSSNEKLDPIVDMVQEDFESGATHVNLTTYHHVVAEELAGRLEDSIGKWSVKPIVFHLGRAPEKKRHEIIAEARRTPHAILVTTMKAINVGINTLTKFSPSYCVELYGAPGVVNQWAGRFHRVGSESNNPQVRFVVFEGTGEEQIAAVLEKRMKEAGKVLPSSHMEKAIMEALDEEEESPLAFVGRVRAAVAAGAEEDPYL